MAEVPLTLRELCSDRSLGLAVVTGHDQLDRTVTWAHVSELADPTPFLDGGELLLTTGVALPDSGSAVLTRLSRLAEAKVTALGFGIGLSHPEVPGTVIDAARTLGLPVIAVPKATQFMSIAKVVARAQSVEEFGLLRSNYHCLRLLLNAAHKANGPRSIARRAADLIGGWAAVLDPAGHVTEISHSTARSGVALVWGQRGKRLGDSTFVSTSAEEIVCHPLTTSTGKVLGYLAAGRSGALEPGAQATVLAAASLLTLMTAYSHDSRTTMQHLRTVSMHQLLDGQLAIARRVSAELWGGFPSEPFRVLHVAGDRVHIESACRRLIESLSREIAFGLVGGVLLVIVSVPEAARMMGKVTARNVTVGVSNEAWWDELSRARRQAAQGAAEAVQTRQRIVEFSSLNTAGLTSFLDIARSEAYAAAQFEPLLRAEGGSNLYLSLATWLAHNGSNDPAASALGIHRHTLRNRLARIEKILGVDLNSPTDRAELWLSLRLLGDTQAQPE